MDRNDSNIKLIKDKIQKNTNKTLTIDKNWPFKVSKDKKILIDGKKKLIRLQKSLYR